MAWLKIYEWEREKFPELWSIMIKPEHRIPLTRWIAESYGFHVGVKMTTRGGGKFYRWVSNYNYPTCGTIRLPIEIRPCSLGLIVHELAHAFNFVKNEGIGHTGTFRQALIRLCVEVPNRYKSYWLPKLETIDWERDQEIARTNARFEIRLEKARKLKARRKTAEFKRAVLALRIKRLESRAKRIATLLKTAHRRLRHLDKKLASKTVDPVNNMISSPEGVAHGLENPIQTT